MVKRLLDQRKFPKKRQGVFQKTEIALISVHLETGRKSRFQPGDLVTRTGHREIRSVSGRLPDYSGELACMQLVQSFILLFRNLM